MAGEMVVVVWEHTLSKTLTETSHLTDL
ncbi:uncharacterized protein METZ01_LOCUS269258 [marine metagenome]|uniref:Uncharacterized protein n=1 Tax=marine metagenome TaxID=408172 RepID=A0A382JV95_9ZZZZ